MYYSTIVPSLGPDRERIGAFHLLSSCVCARATHTRRTGVSQTSLMATLQVLQDDGASSESLSAGAFFAIGMAAMLLLPLMLAACCVRLRCWRRHGTVRHRVPSTELPLPSQSACDTSSEASLSDREEEEEDLEPDEEAEALKPSIGAKQAAADQRSAKRSAERLACKMMKHGSGAMRFESSRRSLTTVHFRKAGWSTSARRPLKSKVALHGVQSLKVAIYLV